MLQTPGRDWIFIVDGHPVLTFWGFTEKGIETAGADPFYFLRPPKHAEPAPAAPQPEPAPAPEPAPEQAPAPSPEPAAGAAGAASAAGAGTAAAAGSEKVTGERTVEKKSFWAMIPAWLWWLLLFLLLLLLLLLLWFYLLKPRFSLIWEMSGCRRSLLRCRVTGTPALR